MYAKWIDSDLRFAFSLADNGGVEITAEEHTYLLDNQSAGATIQPDENGFPVAVFPSPPTLAETITTLCQRIDAEADAARLKIIGDPTRLEEYKTAAVEAQAYKDAGYTGEVPPSVLSWVEAKGWTAQQATDDILTVAAAWNQAKYSIRDIRLKGKELVKANTTEAGANTEADAVSAQIVAVLVTMGLQ